MPPILERPGGRPGMGAIRPFEGGQVVRTCGGSGRPTDAEWRARNEQSLQTLQQFG
jgi:hypothetical protein